MDKFAVAVIVDAVAVEVDVVDDVVLVAPRLRATAVCYPVSVKSLPAAEGRTGINNQQ